MNRLSGKPTAPPPQPKWNSGPIERVPCPSCGKVSDFRNLESQNLLDTGHRLTCTHCGRVMEVCRIQRITMVAVRPWRPRGAPGQSGLPSAQQATTISHAQLNRLLKGG